MSYLRRQGNQNSCFINFWRSKFLKSTILGILSTLKSPDYYSEYVFNITRKSNENCGHQNNVVTLTVRNCNLIPSGSQLLDLTYHTREAIDCTGDQTHETIHTGAKLSGIFKIY